MRTNLHQIAMWRLTATLCTALLATALQEPGRTDETAAPAGPRPTGPRYHVPTPEVFDRESVQKLLDDIDQPRVPMALKMGYFSRRGNRPLPVAEGYALLKAALQKEPEGSKRWFLLQEVRGYAAFHEEAVTTTEGLEAYDAIFSHDEQARQNKVFYSLATSIREYLSQVEAGRAKGILTKAWAAYFRTISGRKGLGNEPRWNDAISAVGMQQEFAPKVEEILNDPAIPKTYGLLKNTAQLLRNSKPQKALDLLREAKPLLTEKDTEEAERYYDLIVGWLLQPAAGAAVPDEKALQEAVALQLARIKTTGEGRARLIEIYDRLNNDNGIVEIVLDLQQPDANESEINDVGAKLISLAGDTTKKTLKQDQAIRLLSGYLQRPPVAADAPARTRDLRVARTMRARILLGQIYIARQNWEQAQQVLEGQDLSQTLPPGPAAGYAGDIRRLLEAVKKKNA